MKRNTGDRESNEEESSCFWFNCLISGERSLTTLQRLIGAIAAVVVMVTHKVLGDAQSVLAHELIAAACVVEY